MSSDKSDAPMEEITIRAARLPIGDDDQELLAKMLLGEAAGYHGQPNLYEGLAWAAVNRQGAQGFPNTLQDVIYQRQGDGTYQFNSVKGPLWRAAEGGGLRGENAEVYRHAREVAGRVLSGEVTDPTGGATHFYTGRPETPPRGWFSRGLQSGALAPTEYLHPFTFVEVIKK